MAITGCHCRAFRGSEGSLCTRPEVKEEVMSLGAITTAYHVVKKHQFSQYTSIV